LDTINSKPFQIPKQLVWEAWKLVKANAGSAGVDGESLEAFERNLKDNLYKLWNRMTSGSYVPPPVKGVAIPKKSGGQRMLGVPCVSDRIAQTVVKLIFEPIVEKVFLSDSYGYRPNKSAHDAVDITRLRCRKYDWVLEFDIKGLFDNIPHELLLKAVGLHTQCKWALLYIERWLKAPMVMPDGTIKPRDKGTPQGGVISPVLSNLFLHYVFDKWMTINYKENPWCRYADDGLVHCKSYDEANSILGSLGQRFNDCGLELHPEKTKIVYCKDSKRKQEYPIHEFKFLGFTFIGRTAMNRKTKELFNGFQPAVSKDALRAMRKQVKQKWKLHLRSEVSLETLAKTYNPIIRGWIQYYGKFYKTELSSLANYINLKLVRWARRKYKSLKGHKQKAYDWLVRVFNTNPTLFEYWKLFKVC
jgi:group II intron reverse transcriptase/maturase